MKFKIIEQSNKSQMELRTLIIADPMAIDL